MAHRRFDTAAALALVLFAPAGGASDESDLRAAWESARYAASPTSTGWEARHPGQQWVTTFDGDGFTVDPDAANWTWGLELKSYGFPSAERAIDGGARVTAHATRVNYSWDATLDEWYVNHRQGLEHGFTVHRRPPRAGHGEDPLTFTIAVRGSLSPVVDERGQDVRFVGEDGRTALTYAGLKVNDVTGRVLPARFDRVAGGLRLTVDEHDAIYPIVVDPIVQQAFLKASNTGPGDQFGFSVAISGDTAVVGAVSESSAATGVDGHQQNDNASTSGAVYVFVRQGATWAQQAYLKASNTDAVDFFGSSVAISGDTLVVGAAQEDSGATGVNGNQADNSALASGAAYVFVRAGSTWSQQAYLKASNAAPGDEFGFSVSISGDTLVVGAQREDSGAPGVNGNQADDSAADSGAAYVFVRSGATWSQEAYLKASSPGPGDEFARSVSVSGDTVVVGAPYEDSNASGVNGNPNDDSASGSGAAYVFHRTGTTWSQQAYVKASNAEAEDWFGFSVGLSGDTVVAGARREGGSAVGVNGPQNNASISSGAAYVFGRTGTTWSEEAYLKASNTNAYDAFGVAVAISGDAIVVTATGEDGNATGVNGSQGNGIQNSGAAYVFVRSGGVWAQQAYLKASNTGFSDNFGDQAGVSGDTVIVGASFEDSPAMGVDSPFGIYNGAPNAGAAYTYSVPCGSITPYGTGCAGSAGFVPTLAATGCATLLGTLDLEVRGGLGGAPMALFVGTASASQSIGAGCSLLVSAPLLMSGFVLSGSGAGAGLFSLTTVVPPNLPLVTVTLQAAIGDAASGIGFSVTNGLQLDLE